MRLLLVIPLLLTTVFAAGTDASASEPPLSPSDSAFVADTGAYLGRLEKLGLSAVVLIARNGDILLEDGYGLADREGGVPWSPSTVSTLGSITKQFTAAAILTLEEDGKLRVEDPITEYFADVPPDKQQITLHQLLTHSSGIADLDGAGDWDPIDREEFVRRALAQDLAFPPGTDYQYSNAGYSLLGAIIEQLTGESYEQYIHDRLFVPNGMQHTGYLLADWEGLPTAIGYSDGERWGTVLGRPMAPDGPYWVLRANGGIHSTAGDMLAWADALLAGRVLTPASMEKLWAPHVDEGGGDSFYGYGWVVLTGPGERTILTHNGGNGIYFADYAIVPGDGLVTFLMTNAVSELRATQDLLLQIGERLYAGTPYPHVPDRIEINPQAAAALAGTYRMEDGPAFQVNAAEGDLLVTPADREAFAVLHSTRPLDAARTGQLSERMDAIVGAFMDGNFEPLAEAYGNRVTPERLAEYWDRKQEEMAEESGAVVGYEVLGSALRDEREVTVVRFTFERGRLDRAYVWTMDEEPGLLGISSRGLDPELRFVPTGEAVFASWDGGITASRPLRFETAADGSRRLEFGEGAGKVRAEEE